MILVEQDFKKYPQYVAEVKRYLNVLATLVMSDEPKEVFQSAEHQLLEGIRQYNQADNQSLSF